LIATKQKAIQPQPNSSRGLYQQTSMYQATITEHMSRINSQTIQSRNEGLQTK
jgi:hypothetical protein